jgi:uncharacterized protein with PQ loop repeat
MKTHHEYTCQISGRSGNAQNMLPAKAISQQVVKIIKKYGHKWDRKGFVDAEAINHLLQLEPPQDSDILVELSADELEDNYQSSLSFGERIADRIAEFGGSWTFIISFFVFILAWVVLNTVAFKSMRYDEYPFILLNLILSCIAAVQAPIIMMSQNRQEAKDRLRAKNDYNINLKAEQEIRELNAKIDELIKIDRKKGV